MPARRRKARRNILLPEGIWTECEPGVKDQVEAQDGWMCEWQPGKWHKGLAVLTRSPYRVEFREGSENFFISSLISGPHRFRFVGFWAMTAKDTGYGYPQQAKRLIDSLPDDGVPTVVAGDSTHRRADPTSRMLSVSAPEDW